jgi:hypothetical protein
MRRAVLLGASNLTLGFPLVVNELRSKGEPLEILAAHGHGRSYGRWSRVLFRGLPGITESGLWRELESGCSPATRTWALVTDVGNDLLYHSPVDEITSWVETCLQRLAAHNADIILTLPPLAALEQLSPWRFQLLRSLIFPASRLQWAELQTQARELDRQLRILGDRFAARVVEPVGAWYGFDPIHIRWTQRAHVWREIFAAWSEGEGAVPPPAGQARLPAVWKLRPQERRLFRSLQTAPQPTWQRDGVKISLF